jgi:hypothetical protein
MVNDMNIRLASFLATFLLIGSGCTHIYVPNSTTFDFDAIPEFTSSKSISLTNAAQNSENVLFATNMGHKWYGDMRKWTDVAIAITERELTKRGMNISDSGEKSLNMSIKSARMSTGGWGFRGYVTLAVETGDGQKMRYVGEGPSPTLTRAIDAAIMRAVAQMLKDEKITGYLTQ